MKHTDQYHGLVPGFQGNSVRLLSHTIAAQIKNSAAFLCRSAVTLRDLFE